MISNMRRQLVIFAPLYRYYDYVDGLAENIHSPLVPLRAYETLSDMESAAPCTGIKLGDLDEGETVTASKGFLWKVNELEPICLKGNVFRVCTKDVLRIGSYDTGVFLSSSNVALRYAEVGEAFRVNGIIPGAIVELEQWIIPDRLIKLKGVRGIYYPAFLKSD